MEDKQIYCIYREFEANYWWFRGRRIILRDQLSRHIKPSVDSNVLEIGCGTGGNLNFLGELGKVFGSDISFDALKLCGSKDTLIVSDALYIPFKDGAFSLVAVLDVLEHLPEPEKCLMQIHRVLKSDGWVVLTVPAFQFLYSPYADHGHKKRYLRNEIADMVESAGFELEKLSYFNSILFPLMVLERLMEKLKRSGDPIEITFKKLPCFLNTIFTLIFTAEKFLLSKMNLPFGGSIVCIAKKRNI